MILHRHQIEPEPFGRSRLAQWCVRLPPHRVDVGSEQDGKGHDLLLVGERAPGGPGARRGQTPAGSGWEATKETSEP
ncbi:hypothetical protein GCM10022380_17730 [Amycolatopsis tucumanensis]|uniref:Uncharacterized protein n=1 Tax=Amycolatopsis tucumanensis TaxID=401106 RepID=A0ABP7HNZ0_9PSEU